MTRTDVCALCPAAPWGLTGVQISAHILAFTSSGSTPRSAFLGPSGNSAFNFVRNHRTVVHSGGAVLPPAGSARGFPVPHILACTSFLSLCEEPCRWVRGGVSLSFKAHLARRRVSRAAFPCARRPLAPVLGEGLCESLSYFLIGLFVFVVELGVLYILGINPFSDV